MMSNYSFILSLEEQFDPNQSRKWMLQHRRDAFYYTGAYVLLIFTLKRYMENRPRLELRNAVIMWNTLLAIFSITTACRTLPELADSLTNYGFAHSVCSLNFIAEDRVTAFWCWMMTISKVPELVDTFFVVFRKHQLIFLHWYHHVTVLLFAWYCYSEHGAPARWYTCMNCFAHSFMYTYYALRAIGVKLPKPVALSITLIQISQMLIGFYVCYFGYVTSLPCHFPKYLGIYGMMVYGSYSVLFLWFFYSTYLNSGKRRSKLE